MPPKKRKELTLEERVKLLEESKAGKSQRKLAETFAVSLGTVNKTLKDKDGIMQRFLSGENKYKKRKNVTSNDVVEEKVVAWFRTARAKKICVTGPLLQAKAIEFSRSTGNTDFKASNGWLQKFQSRHQMSSRSLSGGSEQVSPEVVDDWITHRPPKMSPAQNRGHVVSSGHSFIKLESCESAGESDNDTDTHSNGRSIPEAASPSSSELAEITDYMEDTERRRKSAEPVRVRQDDPGRSVPIRCHIEPSLEQSSQPYNEGAEGHVDTYAIVPSATPFCEVVRVALLKLGYSMSDAVGAKGWIQIKNWLPLSLDQISASKDSTVEDILADVSSVVTLKIKMCSRSRVGNGSNGALDVRDKLLHLLLTHSRALLQTSGCPVEKDLQTIVANGDSTMDADKCRQFENWYKLQLERMKPQDDEPRDLSERRESPREPPQSPRDHDSRSSSPKLPVSYPRPRFRTSFDPDLEIPRLQQWFQESTHPSRERMLHYLQVLNSLGTRKNRKPLDLTNIIYWFKNARAAQRRANRTTEVEEESADDIPQLPNKNAVYMFSPHKEDNENQPEVETRTESASKHESEIKTEDEALDMTKKSPERMDDSDSNSGDEIRELDYQYRPDLLPHQMPQLHLVPMHYRLNTLMQAHTNLQQQHYYNSVMHQRPLMDERRKRTRVFIDPLSEIPKLEAWFLQDSHPTSYMIEKYAEELNQSEYRQRFPKLEPKNIQLWFKNHRAKVKRARMEAENKNWEDRGFHNGC